MILKFKYVIFQEHFRIWVLVDLGKLKISIVKPHQCVQVQKRFESVKSTLIFLQKLYFQVYNQGTNCNKILLGGREVFDVSYNE